MDTIRLEADLVINLIELCNDRGLPSPITSTDINDIVNSDVPNAEKIRQLNRLHSSLHEILYSPPKG